MKVLYIHGDDDYHFIIFEEQIDYSIKYIVDICDNSDNKTHRFDSVDASGNYAYFDATLYEFDEVDSKFIDFIKSVQDHDTIKHSNWIVVK